MLQVSILLTNDVVKEPTLRSLLQQEENSLADHFETFFESGEFSDVKLCCGRKVLDAHKFILESRSPVFSAMFKNDMKEKNNNKVVLKEITFETLRLMIRYLYTSKIDENDLKVHCLNLYKAADMVT